MPNIKELSSKAHDLYWQIEAWMTDFDIPEERVNEALRAASELDDELAKLYKDLEIRRQEDDTSRETDDRSMSITASSSPGR